MKQIRQPAQELELELVYEAKIHALLENPIEKRFEASGACVKDGRCYVIFDNSSYLACFALSSLQLISDGQMIALKSHFSGYEDIAYDPKGQRFFMLIEAQKFSPGCYKARIEEYDNDLKFLSAAWVDAPFKHINKGLEGLACVYLDERLYLLGLCEGNKCKGGAAGRTPGHGRIKVFARSKDDWRHVQTIRLPKTLRCKDYASLDVMDKRIAVVSQASSRLWLGTFRDRSGAFTDDGKVYRFPKNRKNKTAYCNIEGVSWLTADRILVVSDKRKPRTQAKRCRRKDQSIHIFRIPEA